MSVTPIALGTVEIMSISAINFGAADIATNRGVLYDTSNPPVGNTAGGVVLPTASGGVAGTAGITIETLKGASAAPYGPAGRVLVFGQTWALADGSITYGAYVQISDTSGKLGYVKTCGSGIEALGQAITAGTDGNPVMVRVCPSHQP